MFINLLVFSQLFAEDFIIESKFKQKTNQKYTFFTGSRLQLFTDREIYPHFVQHGTGRVRLVQSGGHALKSIPKLVFRVLRGDNLEFEQSFDIQSLLIDFKIDLTKFSEGEYTFEAHLMDGEKTVFKESQPLNIRREQRKTKGKIALHLPAAPADHKAYPITFGVPMPWGALYHTNNIRLLDHRNKEIPLQAEATSYWDISGSIRWLLIDAILPIKKQQQNFTLEYGEGVTSKATENKLSINNTKGNLQIMNGKFSYRFDKSNTMGLSDIQTKGSSYFLKGAKAGPYMVDEKGTKYWGYNDPNPEVTLESSGPLKALVKVKGWHMTKSGKKLGQYILRHRIYAGLPHVFIDHTFIITHDSTKVRYRDIAYALPVNARQGLFGGHRLVPYNLKGDSNAYMIQRDDLYGKVLVNGNFEDEFGKSEGWVNTGSFTLSVRDFWQQFPKELEAKPKQLISHFWPAHNEAPIRTGKNLSIRNAYQMWFAHEGQLLDFKVPQEVLKYIKKDNPTSGYHISAQKANAMGLSKTHHMLLQIHSQNWEQARARSFHKIFQWTPTMVCDPKWVAASKAFGHMAAKNPKKFPRIEKSNDGMINTMMRYADIDRDYGMFIFGDAHHKYNYAEKRISYYRLWKVTHHHYPRWPWIHYARSGSKKIFDYARRNASYVANIAHCHYTTSEFQKGFGGDIPDSKMLGGICDYKGYVPWNTGDRIGYNSVSDSMLQHFYFTGDRRSLDTAILHGEALLGKHFSLKHKMVYRGSYPLQGSREGSGRIISAVELFLKTWDNDYLEFADRHVRTYIQQQMPNGDFPRHPSLTFWTPSLSKFVDLTRSKKTENLIVRHMNLLKQVGEKAYYSHQWAINGYASMLGYMSHAYIYTKDLEFLRCAKVKTDFCSYSFYDGDDYRFEGMPAGWPKSLPWAFQLIDSPVYLYAAEQYGKPIKTQELTPKPRIATLTYYKDKGKSFRHLRARIKQPSEAPFQIHAKLRANIYEGILRQIDGSKVYKFKAKPINDRQELLHFEVPEDGALEYELILRCHKSYEYVQLPLAKGQKGLKEVYPIGKKGLYLVGGEPFYFSLPDHIKNFRLSYQSRNVTSLAVRNKKGENVYEHTYVGQNGSNSLSLSSKEPIKNWSLFAFGTKGEGRTHLNGFSAEGNPRQPLWIATSPEKHFFPNSTK